MPNIRIEIEMSEEAYEVCKSRARKIAYLGNCDMTAEKIVVEEAEKALRKKFKRDDIKVIFPIAYLWHPNAGEGTISWPPPLDNETVITLESPDTSVPISIPTVFGPVSFYYADNCQNIANDLPVFSGDLRFAAGTSVDAARLKVESEADRASFEATGID